MENSIINRITDSLDGSVLQQSENANVGKSERIVSLGAGAFIALKGITNVFSHPLLALTELGLGGALLYRGFTGYCPVKEKLEDQRQQESSFNSSTITVTAMPTESY